MSENEWERGRIIGIGGIFFKSPEAEQLRDWYHAQLGFDATADGFGFLWRDHARSEVVRRTVWSVFSQSSNYFDPSKAPFMINYMVDDLDAFLAKMQARGVAIDAKRESYDYGRFAWIYDPDGNKIELWEPPEQPR
jgi:catechol 2,3-dioxygenase-like lactoylglutathione lyase family enzyme